MAEGTEGPVEIECPATARRRERLPHTLDDPPFAKNRRKGEATGGLCGPSTGSPGKKCCY